MGIRTWPAQPRQSAAGSQYNPEALSHLRRASDSPATPATMHQMRSSQRSAREGNQMRELVWFSCGAASAVAAKKAVEKYPNALVIYNDTLATEHPDNARFMSNVSDWIGKKILILKSDRYATVDEVIEKRRYMSGPEGALCTVEMKKIPPQKKTVLRSSTMPESNGRLCTILDSRTIIALDA
jgi:hypothetical protein